MNKSTDKNKTNRKEIEENKKNIQKQIDKKVEEIIDKGFAKYPKIFKKVK